MNLATVKRGDIYYVAGAVTTGSEQSGDRPAVVVSNNAGNKYAPIVEVVYLTTRKKTDLPTHAFVGSAERPSIAMCEQIVTVCKSRLERYIGRITEEEMRGIDKALQRSLGIHKTGDNAMQITMITPFGEMKFDMPPAKATDLMQRAFQYAAGQEVVKETTEVHIRSGTDIPPIAPGQALAISPVPEAAAPSELAAPPKNPVSRVERMFGGYRATGTATMEKVSASGHINVTPETIARKAPEAPQDGQQRQYKGFLLVKCERCGKVKGFCAKTPISAFRCECGHRTELRDLAPAHLKCKCGSQFTYNTNFTERQFDYPCLHCGSPIDLELNKRGDTYVTITD